MEWNEEKAQEIVQKHKNRFSIKLSLQIIRVFVLILILFSVYKMALEIVYDGSKFGKRTEFYQKLAVDWTAPELKGGLGVSHSNEITSFFTQKITFPLEKRIGKTEFVESELTLTKPLITAFSTVSINGNISYDKWNNRFSFDLPINPQNGKILEGQDSPDVWKTLDMVHEGNVANLAFSLDDYYTPKEISELLSNYDLDILWMPIYMGELQNFTEGGWGGGTATMSLTLPWGLTGGREMHEDFKGGSLIHVLDEETIEESERIMLENMDAMLASNKRLAERLLNTEYLQERADYLREEGFKAYGAVVTGPVKELLKLQELDEVRSVQLGEIKHWNWVED